MASNSLGQLTERTDWPRSPGLLLGGVILLTIAEDDLTAGEIELERDVDQGVERLTHVGLLRGRHEEQEEPAAPSTDQLAADRTRAPRRVIERVDVRVRDASAQTALGQPRFMEELTEFQDVAVAADDRDALVHQILHDSKLAAPVVDSGHKAFRDVRRGAFDPRIEQHEVGGELVHAVGADGHRRQRDSAVLMDHNVIQAAVGRQHLILRADGFLQDVLLQVHAFRRQAVFTHHLALERIEGVEQAHREGRAGPDATAGRNVRVVVNLYTALDLQIAQRLTNGRMRDLFDRLTVLDLGVDDAVPMVEKGRQVATVDVAILVDRRRQHGAAMLVVPVRIIRAATEKGDTKRRSANDHRPSSRPWMPREKRRDRVRRANRSDARWPDAPPEYAGCPCSVPRWQHPPGWRAHHRSR